METNPTTLRWALLFMAHQQENIQQRVYVKIHDHIGAERPPHVADRSYTEDVLCKIQRSSSIVSKADGLSPFGR